MRWLLAFVVLVAGATAAQAQEKLVAVPFVGCAADGQVGPLKPPKAVKTPLLPAAVAAQLAYYVAPDEVTVLAPRGWKCWEAYGSNGSTLMVAPSLSGIDLFSKNRLRGPFVTLTVSFGRTSGRTGVASVAGLLFPIAKEFVDDVKEFTPDLKFVDITHDKLIRRSDTVVEFTTPANMDGLGTSGWADKSSWPIDGVAILIPTAGMDLVTLRIRLPPASRLLAPKIIKQMTEMVLHCECGSERFKR